MERARIVLASADRGPAQRVAQRLGVSRPTVWRWQQRFAGALQFVVFAMRRCIQRSVPDILHWRRQSRPLRNGARRSAPTSRSSDKRGSLAGRCRSGVSASRRTGTPAARSSRWACWRAKGSGLWPKYCRRPTSSAKLPTRLELSLRSAWVNLRFEDHLSRPAQAGAPAVEGLKQGDNANPARQRWKPCLRRPYCHVVSQEGRSRCF